MPCSGRVLRELSATLTPLRRDQITIHQVHQRCGSAPPKGAKESECSPKNLRAHAFVRRPRSWTVVLFDEFHAEAGNLRSNVVKRRALDGLHGTLWTQSKQNQVIPGPRLSCRSPCKE